MVTVEVESLYRKHDNVASVAVVSQPHPLKSEGIFAYFVLKSLAPEHKNKMAIFF